MCLIVFAYQQHREYPLIIGANRDEFYNRPTQAMNWWDSNPDILAGKDLLQGGIWCGANRDGRFAAVTNYRGLQKHTAAQSSDKNAYRSRGKLPLDFLTQGLSEREYLANIRAEDGHYDGFNLLIGSIRGLFHYSNREHTINTIEVGVHGLSNDLLDTPWPKVSRAKQAMTHWLQRPNDPREIFEILHDRTPAPDTLLPQTGIALELERGLSSCFIDLENYGTRSSTVLLMGQHSAKVLVREYHHAPASISENEFAFSYSGA